MGARRILVPVDFSKTSTKAVLAAQRLAAATPSEIVLLHVVQPVIIGASPDVYGASQVLLSVVADQEKLAKRQIERLAARVRRQSGATVKTLVRVGAPYERILGAAERISADLIVMGTQGRSGLSHLFLGSVAERVVRLAKCPVLTVGARARVAASPRRRKR